MALVTTQEALNAVGFADAEHLRNQGPVDMPTASWFLATEQETGTRVLIKLFRVPRHDLFNAELATHGLLTAAAEAAPAGTAPFTLDMQGHGSFHIPVPGRDFQLHVPFIVYRPYTAVASVELTRHPDGMPLADVAQISASAFRAIRALHAADHVHGHIQPDNVALIPPVGGHGRETAVLINMEYAQRFQCAVAWNSARTRHIARSWVRHDARGDMLMFAAPGTVYLDAAGTVRQRAQGCRDDLLSFIYTLVFLRTATLPWAPTLDSTTIPVPDIYDLVNLQKDTVVAATLCERIPRLAEALEYVQALRFSETPDYARLEAVFCSLDL